MNSVVIAAPSSGSGKTTVTMGLLQALVDRGRTVQAFKVGPDYVDPAHHEKITGRPSINLDPWMTSDRQVRDAFYHYGSDVDVCVVEGVMGLFDGKQGDPGTTSTAHVAQLLGISVLLVLDVSKVARTAAANVLGIEQFSDSVRLGGVVLNRVAGERHEAQVREAIEERCCTAVVGAIPHDDQISLPERQLGLTSVYEQGLSGASLDRLATHVKDGVDLDAIPSPDGASEPVEGSRFTSPEQNRARVGVAQDPVFCFYYEENLRLLRQAGAELVPFSPLNDGGLPSDLDALYFGGGFPEEFAAELEGNRDIMTEVEAFQGPILAECGGLIYLCDRFRTRDGTNYYMAGEIPATIQMTDSLTGFGYREVTCTRDTLLGLEGTRLRGHLFHYSEWVEEPPEEKAMYDTGRNVIGYFDGRVQASFFHVHLGSWPEAAEAFLDACE